MRGVVIGTGPSLSGQIDSIKALQKQDFLLFGVNNTYLDFQLDCWLACDPKWHEIYSPVSGDFDKWHWDRNVCQKYGYTYVEGVWADGLSTDPAKIHFNHGSGPQILNLAVTQYACDPILLAGHDFSDSPVNRHYFKGLSDIDGEYPPELRKHSKYIKSKGTDDMLHVYKRISEQSGLPRIVNCTPGSRLPWFERGRLEDFLERE